MIGRAGDGDGPQQGMSSRVPTTSEGAGAVALHGGSHRKEAFTVRDLLIVAFYHRRLILFAALLPLLVAIGASLVVKKTFLADGLMMVLVNREVSGNQGVTDSGPAVLSIEGLKSVQSEVEIITSAGVIRETIDKIGLEKLYPEIIEGRFHGLLPPTPEERRLEKAMELFRSDLRANVESESNIIRISYRHPDRATAIAVVNTLMDAYRERRQKVFDNPRAPFLAGEVERFKQQLDAAEIAIQKVKAQYDVIDIEQDRLLAANQIDSVLQRHRQVSERRAGITAQLDEAERQMTALPRTVFDFRTKSDGSVNDDDRNLLTRLLVDRERLASQYAPGYPELKELDQKIAAVRQAMKSRDVRISTTNRDVRNPAVSYLTNMILNLRVERDALEQQLAELDRQKRVAEARGAELRTASNMLVDLQRRRDVLEDSYRQYVKRADAAKIEENAALVRSSNVRLVQTADAPITGRDLRLPFLAAGLAGSLLFGGAAGAFGAWLRRSFITPAEVERTLHIPELTNFADSGGQFVGRGVRESLAHLAALLLDTTVEGRSLQVIQLVSLGDNEGRRPLGRALAEEIATERQLRTLFVDCGNARDRGRAAAAPSGAAKTPTLAVATSGVPMLWLASDGPRSALTTLRAPIREAREELDALREEYDVLIVSAPSQGLSPLTQRLAAIVDANILVVRSEVSRVPAVARLRDMILESGGGLLGFVFTGRKYYIPRWVYRWI